MNCPFCGDEGAIDELGTGSHPIYAVICQGCGAVGPADENPTVASRAWDHRPPHEHGLPFLPGMIVKTQPFLTREPSVESEPERVREPAAPSEPNDSREPRLVSEPKVPREPRASSEPFRENHVRPEPAKTINQNRRDR